MSLAEALKRSGLRFANVACDALLQGGEGYQFSDSLVSCKELLRTYRIRQKRIREFNTGHARDLADSADEFVANLERHSAESCRWCQVQGVGDLKYWIFVISGDEDVIGCMPVISKLDVSAERWRGLWGDA